MRILLLSACILGATAAAQQTKAPISDIYIKGKSGGVVPTGAVAAAEPQIAKSPDGKWRCADPAGKPCSVGQLQVMQAAMKGRSNIKNNLSVSPDGTVQCTSSGKPCTDAEMQSAAAEWSKAAQKGGRNEN